MLARRLVSVSVGALVAAAVAGTPAVAQEDADEPESKAASYQLNVTLQEWAVIPDSLSIPAGEVTINATNVGPNDPHELVVVKTDIPAGELPTNDNGSFDEDADGVEVIGEIEEFDVGGTESMTLNLEPGNYVFLCNLVEREEEIEAHYALGMWIGVEVTA